MLETALRWAALLTFAGFVWAPAAGCDSPTTSESGAESGSKSEPSTDEAAAKESLDKKVDEAVAKADKEARVESLFDPEDETFRKQACEILTPVLVADHFGVPKDELRQTKIMGCVYTWQSDGVIVEANLMMPRIHKSIESAKQWYGNATATRTKEELDAQLDQVKGKLDESKDLDTESKKNTAKGFAELGKMAMPDAGVRYDDVPGVADEARVSSADGILWVRMANLTFQVTGFKGPEKPQTPFDIKNPKGLAKAAMETQKKWVADTLEQRKRDATALAPKVVAAITERRSAGG